MDFYFVDGGHRYSTALRDLEAAYPFMNAGSTIIVDDFHSKQCPIDGVIKAVDEFIENHELDAELEYRRTKTREADLEMLKKVAAIVRECGWKKRSHHRMIRSPATDSTSHRRR